MAWVTSSDYKNYVSSANNTSNNTSAKSADIPNGYYYIASKLDNAKVIDINGAKTDNGIPAILWDYNGCDNQIFYIEKLSDGTYRIKAKHSNRYIEVRNSSHDNGADVAQWDWDDNYACKRWYIVDAGGGYYKFVNKESGKVIDVQGGNSGNGTRIQQYESNGTNSQYFKLVSVGGGSSSNNNVNTNATVKATRNELVEKAKSLVNRVPYFWGGKYSKIGENPEWKTQKTVTSSGSRTTNMKIAYGLDCSGFVDWVYYQFGYTGFSGKNSAGQNSHIKSISESELKPGDIGYEIGHIGIYAGDGYWVHAVGNKTAILNDGTYCEGGKVTLDKYKGFTKFGTVGSFIGD